MKPFLLVSAFLHAFLLAFVSLKCGFAAYVPPDNYLVACGSSQSVSFQGLTYAPDSNLSSSGYVVLSNDTTLPPIYQSARVFSSFASYHFKIHEPGRHWIRLYFHPVFALNTSSAINVLTDDFVLINNFTFGDSDAPFFFKEYAINITSSSFNLHFLPPRNSVTFVNAIEIVSIPGGIFPDLVTLNDVASLSDLAFETVYRLNMGGPLITPKNDTLGRIWENDAKYLHLNSSAVDASINPASVKYTQSVESKIAPNWVYATAAAMEDVNVPNSNFNISWVLPVDKKYRYFVRVHFCDIISKALNTLVFNLYIGDEAAFQSLDLSLYTGALEVPYYRDFVTENSLDSDTLIVSIGPDMDAEITNATLNGLEIMKLSNEVKSLDGFDSVASFLPNQSPENISRKRMFGIITIAIGGVLLAFGLITVCYCCLFPRLKKTKNQSPWLSLPVHGSSQTMTNVSTVSQKSGTTSVISLTSSNHGRIFTFQEILDATNKFDESFLLGVGGFGRVYKGTLEDGTKVAVKRGNSRSEQGVSEFRTEIEMLSKLRHRHLVSLIGYCDECSEMILVYEFMANGPLRIHLYGSELPPLSWKNRLEICIGAARGLHYLHTGAAQSVIHRDVKTTNILLDENFVAKVADFGLSKAGPAIDKTHVSTAVKGSFGYLDPEYFRRQQLTEKSDVYSFGVVLMEVLCTRPALNPVLPREQVNIAEWAMSWQKKGKLEQIIDQNLKGKVNPASLKKYGETAEKCLAEHGAERPSMGDVLWNLEYVLQLEETSCAMGEEDNSMNHIEGIPMAPVGDFDNSASLADGGNMGTDDDTDDAATSAVFSQLVNPLGR